MLVLGLTGQSGAGKGEVARVFSSFEGVVCLDTDKTAREVAVKGSPCLSELCEYFGSEILLNDGTLDRKKLARIAFGDKEKHAKLNHITHFYIMQRIREWLKQAQKDGVKIAVIDAPLLFESHADELCDVTLAVISPYKTRLTRIMARDSVDEKNARIRLDSQPNDSFFREKCTHVIENDDSLASLIKKSENFICSLLSKL